VDHYVESVNYELVNDAGFRAEVEPAWGFCNVHAELWLRQAHPLGTALIYDVVLGRIAGELRRVRLNHRPGVLAGVASRLGRRDDATEDPPGALRPEGRCPICRVRDERERVAIATLLDGLTEPAFGAAYNGSAGLCLPHLRLALGAVEREATLVLLRDRALAQQEHLRGQLREIVRKHDYRYRDEPSGAERGATDRAVRQVAGAPGIADR
jgi:hypothetical protein